MGNFSTEQKRAPWQSPIALWRLPSSLHLQRRRIPHLPQSSANPTYDDKLDKWQKSRPRFPQSSFPSLGDVSKRSKPPPLRCPATFKSKRIPEYFNARPLRQSWAQSQACPRPPSIWSERWGVFPDLWVRLRESRSGMRIDLLPLSLTFLKSKSSSSNVYSWQHSDDKHNVVPDNGFTTLWNKYRHSKHSFTSESAMVVQLAVGGDGGFSCT